MKSHLISILVTISLALVTGCSQMQTYPGYGEWNDEVEELGPVTFCRGGFCDGTDEGYQWPLALALPPTAPTYHSALRQKASSIYHVPVEEVVLSEVNVELTTEVVGTVRGWKASAKAGRRTAPTSASNKGDSVTQRLQELQNLRDQGLIDADDYETRKKEILDEL